jgi:hypothetical protein
MALYDDLIAAVPTLTPDDFGRFGTIELRDDSDGLGAYISKWENAQPIPAGLKLGK